MISRRPALGVGTSVDNISVTHRLTSSMNALSWGSVSAVFKISLIAVVVVRAIWTFPPSALLAVGSRDLSSAGLATGSPHYSGGRLAASTKVLCVIPLRQMHDPSRGR